MQISKIKYAGMRRKSDICYRFQQNELRKDLKPKFNAFMFVIQEGLKYVDFSKIIGQ